MLSIAGVLNSSRPPVSRVPSLEAVLRQFEKKSDVVSSCLRQKKLSKTKIFLSKATFFLSKTNFQNLS